MKLIAHLIFVFVAIVFAKHETDDVFWQEYATHFQISSVAPVADWTQLPFSEQILQVATFQNSSTIDGDFYILTSSSLWLMLNDYITVKEILIDGVSISIGSRIVTLSATPRFFIGTPTQFADCIFMTNFETSCKVFDSNFTNVNDIAASSDSRAWIASDTGLYEYENGYLTQIQEVGQTQFLSVAYYYNSAKQQDIIAAGTNTFLWRLLKGVTWHYFRTPGLIDAAPVALAFDAEGTLWIGNEYCINKQHLDLTFKRIGGLEGLPYYNITSFSLAQDGAMWIGSLKGASRFYNGDWKYYYGPRWLPSTYVNADVGIDDNTVFSVCSSSSKDAILATPAGFSIIQHKQWTLQDKANHFQNLVYPQQNYYGLIGDVGFASFGNRSSYIEQPSDSNGLWTGMYLAAQCYRYAVTKDPEAKKEAWFRFEAMEFLNNVTGIPGLMARSVYQGYPSPYGGEWVNSTAYPGWMWKRDTSSDSVTGHMLVYPLVYNLVAETAEEKARVERLLRNIVTYIITNDYYLFDITGKPTTWGKWNWVWLNDNEDWYDERGLNSLQILSWILAAYNVTGDQIMMNAYNELTSLYNYDINVINAKITEEDPSDIDFSDDELGFLSYMIYYGAEQPVLQTEIQLSIKRSWEFIRTERNPLWNFIYGMSGVQDFDLKEAVNSLRQWPLDCIYWPVDNSHRQDLKLNPYLNRHNTEDTITFIPWDENLYNRYNQDPYTLGPQGSGMGESDPGIFLLPYWMGRYYQYIR